MSRSRDVCNGRHDTHRVSRSGANLPMRPTTLFGPTLILLVAASCLGQPPTGGPQRKVVLVELFTSQG